MHPNHMPPPAKSVSGGKAVLVVVAVLVAFCGIGSLVAMATSGDDNRAATVATVPDRGSVPVVEPPSPTLSAVLLAADVKLTIKVTSKQCFGSAGCNVEFDVKAGWPESAVPRGTECDVTYELRGFTEPQTGTLTVRDDGQYLSDSFNFGQTAKRTSKVTARVTEVECR